MMVSSDSSVGMPSVPAAAEGCNVAIRFHRARDIDPLPCRSGKIDARYLSLSSALATTIRRSLMAVRRFHSGVIGLAAMLTATLASSGTAAAQQTYTLRYAVDTERNINALAQTVAERRGFFTREGINLQPVRFVATGDRPTDRTALVASRDSFDMARMQLSVLMEPEGRFKGTNYVAVSAVVNNPAYFLVARPEIRTFADLKGKVLTEPSPTDPITLTARKLMDMHGLKDGDVEIKTIAGSQPRVDCIKSGACAAASLSQPSVFAAFDAGFHTLAMHIEAGPLLYVVDIVDRSWAETHGETIVRYIRATAAAMRFIQDPRNADEVLKAAMEITHQPEGRAREMMAYFADPKHDVLPKQGEIDVAGVKATIALFGQYGILKAPLPLPERYVDLRFAQMAGVQ
jgi:ABC-type nitrate/sulfonate/bicarbonate transport system substrate-binding protein